MLPEKLSTDLTSLNEGEERVALVMDMTVGAEGSVEKEDVYRARVHNKAQLAYDDVGHGSKGARYPRRSRRSPAWATT